MQNKFSLSVILFIVLCISSNLLAQDLVKKHVKKIAFGSCSHEYKPKAQMWEAVIKQKAQLWIWLGDIVYADTQNMDTLRKKYNQQKNHPLYQKLQKKTNIIGIWDDHDYGVNDGGKFCSTKKKSKTELLRFLETPKNSSVYNHEGAYNAYVYGRKNKKVKIILLDTRYFRDTLYPANDGINRYKPNKKGDILGEKQWQWLEKQLKNSDAQFHIIVSSIQVISSKHPYEKWANFPLAQKRLYAVIQKAQPKRTIILSGDRHIAELSKINLPQLNYPLYDFTTSGLTHTWNSKKEEKNEFREGKLVIEKNYGLIEIDWKKKALTLKALNKNNEAFFTKKLYFSKL